MAHMRRFLINKKLVAALRQSAQGVPLSGRSGLLGATLGSLLTIAAVLMAVPVLAQPKAYPDGHGGEVMFQEGDISFADEVVSYATGSREPVSEARDPKQALGIPNYDTKKDKNFVTLGCGGSLEVRFTDNALVDVPGPDLYVFEIGPAIEATALAISDDGETWTRIGRIEGGKAAIDIAPYVRGGEEFRFVRLVDLREDCGGDWPGADIDAIGAIGSAERIELDSSVLFDTGKYRLGPAAAKLIDDALAGIDREGIQSVVVAGHTDSVGSAEANQLLSKNRAGAVAEYLETQAGFDPDLLSTQAWGESRPIADNDTVEGRARNRRVEITLRRIVADEGEQTDPTEILGLWQVDEYGIVELRRSDGKVTGSYTLDNGRVRGAFTSDTVFEGYWIEDDSGQRCESEIAGSHHWGRLHVEFDSTDWNTFNAKWGYCNDKEWRGDWPLGKRII